MFRAGASGVRFDDDLQATDTGGKTPGECEHDTQAITAQDHIEVRPLPYGDFTAILTPTR